MKRTRRRWAAGLATSALILGLQSTAHGAMITNGSFESGDFTDWIATDLVDPFDPLAVLPGGTVTFFDGFLGLNVVLPSHGGFAVSHGFDGDGPLGPSAAISVAQDIGVIAPGDLLTFDFRAGWDLISFSFPGDLDRLFEVWIEPAGGGAPVAVFLELTAPIGTDTSGGPNGDTGPLSGAIDLTPYAGLDARVNFKWTVPDSFTGPANAQLDNVAITQVPEPGMLGLMGLGLLGLALVRRRPRA